MIGVPTTPIPRESLPPAGPGSVRRRRVFFWVMGVLVVAGLYFTREVLLPFVLAVLIAYLLSPLVQAGERLRVGRWRPARWVVVLAIYLSLLGSLSALLAFAVPRLAGEVSKLAREAPRAVHVLRDQWLPELERKLRAATATYARSDVSEDSEVTDTGAADPLPPDPIGAGAVRPSGPPQAAILVTPTPDGGYEITLPPDGIQINQDGEQSFRVTTTTASDSKVDITSAITSALSRMMENTEKTATTVLQTAQKVVTALTRGIFLFFITLMISAYMLITSDRIFAFLRSFYAPDKRSELDVLLQRIDRGLAGVVRGQLLICGVNGVLSGIGFYFLGLKYWFFLTLVAAVLSVIPIFGSILSSVPAVLIALSDGMVSALLVLGWIVLIHQIEANLLNPKIMGDAARVHPVLVVFALLAGEHVGGFAGALLAVPILSITQTLFLYFREHALGLPRTSIIPPPPPPQAAQVPDAAHDVG